jgi:hypothetical protein
MFLFAVTCLLITGIVIFFERLMLNRRSYFVLPDVKKYIFLGHSHAQTAYNDKYIDSSLNLASAGEAYFYTYIKLRKILEYNRLKRILFVEYSNNNILAEMNNWTWDDIHIKYRYRLYSPFTALDEMKVLYLKNPKAAFICDMKSIINNVYYLFNLENISTEKKMGGYVDLVRDKTDSLLRTISKSRTKSVTDTAISELNIAYLRKIVDACRESGFEVYLIRTPLHPLYKGLDNEAVFKSILNSLFRDVEFLDFRNYPLMNEDFGDFQHINYRGARKYSAFFNNLLKSGLLRKEHKQDFIDEQIKLERNRKA